MELFIFSLKLAIVAYIYSDVLTEGGMILNPMYVFLDTWKYNKRAGKKLIPEWLFKPLIGCYKCVAGQMALWSFFVVNYSEYINIKSIFELSVLIGNHLFFITLTILLSCLTQRIHRL
jgi:membrane-bound metal-dependent hydrolase YbcI (DUF457 family)